MFGCRIPIELYFTPKSDEEVNFNIVCTIKKKIEPLRLNVKVRQLPNLMCDNAEALSEYADVFNFRPRGTL